MEIQQLRTIVEIANIKSISKAAKSLHLSQSALSQQISNIEKQLNYQIFIRNNKGVSLSCYGELIHIYAKKLLVNMIQ